MGILWAHMGTIGCIVLGDCSTFIVLCVSIDQAIMYRSWKNVIHLVQYQSNACNTSLGHSIL